MFSDGGLTVASLALLLFAPMILLGGDYLFDELLDVRSDLADRWHYRALLFVSIGAVSLFVIGQSMSAYSVPETLRLTMGNLFLALLVIVSLFVCGKWLLIRSWKTSEERRIERLDLELPQYLEMFHIMITSGMSVLSALKSLGVGGSEDSVLRDSLRPMIKKSLTPQARISVLANLTGGGAVISSGPRIGEAKTSAQSIERAIVASPGISSKRTKPLAKQSEMKRVIAGILNGVEEGLAIEQALDRVVMSAGSEQLRRFSDAVILGMERGSSMSQTLRNLIQETRNQSKVLVMQRAGKAEIKLLIPVVFLILPISVMFAIWPSYMNLASIMGG